MTGPVLGSGAGSDGDVLPGSVGVGTGGSVSDGSGETVTMMGGAAGDEGGMLPLALTVPVGGGATETLSDADGLGETDRSG